MKLQISYLKTQSLQFSAHVLPNRDQNVVHLVSYLLINGLSPHHHRMVSGVLSNNTISAYTYFQTML